MDTLEEHFSCEEMEKIRRIAVGDVDILDEDELYQKLFEYYFDEMPYGTAKARTGDPYVWVSERLEDEVDTTGWPKTCGRCGAKIYEPGPCPICRS